MNYLAKYVTRESKSICLAKFTKLHWTKNMEDDVDMKNSLEMAVKKARKQDFTDTKKMMDKLMDRVVFTSESVRSCSQMGYSYQ